MTPSFSLRRWQGPSLAMQILGLLLGGLVVAQFVTLLLTLLLPPEPPTRYGLGEIAAALRASGPRSGGLERVVATEAPETHGRGWLVSETSRADLAHLLGADAGDVRLSFYTPLPFAGTAAARAQPDPTASATPEATAVPATRPASLWRTAAEALAPDGDGSLPERPYLMRAAYIMLADGGFPGGGPPGAPGGGMPGGGMSGGGFPGGAFPGGNLPGSSFPGRSAGNFPGGMSANGRNSGMGQSSGAFPTPPPTAADRPNGPGEQSSFRQQQPMSSTPQVHVGAPQFPSDLSGLPAGLLAAPLAPSSALTIDRPAQKPREAAPSQRQNAPRDETGTHGDDPPAPIQPAAHSNVAASPDPAPAAPAMAPAIPTIDPTPTPHPAPSETNTGLQGAIDSARHFLGLGPAPFVEGDFRAALRLPDGRWAIVQPIRAGWLTDWQKRVLLWFALSFALVAPLGWIFARRLSRPLDRFAEAAARLGRDPSAAIATLDGPAEIGRAAHAFNVMQSRLRAFVDDRTAMVGAISHDLRTPLTRMRFRIEDAPDELRQGMLAEVEEMEQMISSVLAFIRDASTPGVRERLDLRTLLDDVAEDAAMIGGDIVVEASIPATVEVDVLGMRRVLANLIENAIKYGQRATVRLTVAGDEAIASVIDSGPGLPENELEQVFQPFYRTAAARASSAPGTGLGLAVCRSIARAHGGDVRLHQSAEGFTAEVRVPLAYAGERLLAA